MSTAPPVSPYSIDSWTTDDVRPPERVEYWMSVLSAATRYRVDPACSPGTFRGRVLRIGTAAYTLGRASADCAQGHRTAAMASADPHDSRTLMWTIRGELLVSQAGQELRVGPGGAFLAPSNSPFEAKLDHADIALLTIPAAEIDNRLRSAALRSAPRIIDINRGLGRVLAGMLGELFAQRAHLSAAEFDAVCDRLVDLLCMLAVGDDRPDFEGGLVEVQAMVRRYVREHATDPGLTGATMAGALGWSLRQVQLALQQAGTTPRELIREERLALVHERLRSPVHIVIGDLAQSCGFSSNSVLSAAFRQRYGMSPRDFRAHYLLRQVAEGAVRAGVRR
ncbi:AraC family transcriptional regulator [Kribbella sp. NPDC058245]|uniref:AraC family transcriptional regulator n=1 Tax=Kribbella sp. NPDC058245 TaxID=3346399 RepID=UPI0036E9742A